MEAVGIALSLIAVPFLFVIGFGLGIAVVIAFIDFLDDKFGMF